MSEGVRAGQFPFVENPATVLLVPVHLGPTTTWWSHDGILVGGLEINTIESIPEGQHHSAKVGYLPTPIPRSWAEKELRLVIEYESKEETTDFQFKLYYGCGDPSELRLAQSNFKKGMTGSKKRARFPLNEEYIKRNELFRATVEVVRRTPDPIWIYGVWLEVGVE